MTNAFVSSPMRDNWYQSSSFYGSSFALITSVNENGITSIGPYQLSFPFEVINERSWMVVSRPGSNTATNVKRTHKCALNFIEYDKDKIQTILEFGFPGQTPAEKDDYNTFELVDSPTEGRESNTTYPKIMKDAFQVFECTLDVDRIEENPILKNSSSAHLLLNIDNILVKEEWIPYIDGTGDKMPSVPMTYGFRGASTFWFGDVNPAYKLPIPDKGAKDDVVYYEANRLDDEIKFTRDACKELTGIPPTFLRQALMGILGVAKEQGLTKIDRDFVVALNKQMNS